MCCKIPIIPELNKPYNTWCTHCGNHASCSIYDTRPQRCRDFMCHFLTSDLSEAWRPSKCRMILSAREDRLVIMVDPARPDSWRKEPHASLIHRWAGQTQVHVMVGSSTFVVFPDHVDDVGEVTDEHKIVTITEPIANGMRQRAIRVHQSEMAAYMPPAPNA
jgi:hypothetical protein